MPTKIPKHLNELIYQSYEEYLDKGTPIVQIASILNEEWGTDYAESSLRGRYTQQKEIYETQEDDERTQKELIQIAQGRLRLKEERKIINKQRTIIDQQVKEYSERSLIKEVISDFYGKEFTHNVSLTVTQIDESKEEYLYAYSDVHLGYFCDLIENRYNIEETINRLTRIYDLIILDALEHGYKKIYISDLGDQIEGSALRISQLVRIAEGMTEQARDYANIIVELIKKVSKYLPNTEVELLMISEDNHAQLRLFSTKRDELPENLALLITNHIQNTIDLAHEYGHMKNINFRQGDEILLKLNGYNVVLAHGHQYGRNENILYSVEQRHGTSVHLFIAGHWHQFSVKYKNVKDGGQQALIFLPSVVGDTDFSERLFLSCYPGFVKITIDLDNKIANARLVRL